MLLACLNATAIYCRLWSKRKLEFESLRCRRGLPSSKLSTSRRPYFQWKQSCMAFHCHMCTPLLAEALLQNCLISVRKCNYQYLDAIWCAVVDSFSLCLLCIVFTVHTLVYSSVSHNQLNRKIMTFNQIPVAHIRLSTSCLQPPSTSPVHPLLCLYLIKPIFKCSIYCIMWIMASDVAAVHRRSLHSRSIARSPGKANKLNKISYENTVFIMNECQFCSSSPE